MSDTRDQRDDCDVLVVGFGGAGACAAIEAHDAGARVVIVERFDGGGATARSGGVVYIGGGSPSQGRAGWDDSVEAMYGYLREETEDAVSEETLRAFCARSLDNAAWLEAQGARFTLPFFAAKTTQPPDGYGLYWSGNEKQRAHAAKPAPRGHVVDGDGMTGHVLFAALAEAVARRGIEVQRHTSAQSLVVAGDGTVVGVELLSLPASQPLRAAHLGLRGVFEALRSARSKRAERAREALAAFERRWGRVSRIDVRGGVILASGGFVFNQALLHERAPRYAECMPLGTAGDDGTAIRLGEAVGAVSGETERCAASRFIAPPEALVTGALVDETGRRFCDETLYGATLSKAISERPGGVAYMLTDAAIRSRAEQQMKQEERVRDFTLGQLAAGHANHLLFRNYCYLTNRHVNRRRAPTLEALEQALAMPPGALVAAVREYNAALASGQPDAFGKARESCAPLLQPPFDAIDCSLDSALFPGPCLTLGGLRVDGLRGRALRADGSEIPGLYAAGRSAVGVASRSYVSGLSLADCVFSGRNAGRDAAERAARAGAGLRS
jgi:3-oxo-5alpha-steroid 4-dehydrogenase